MGFRVWGLGLWLQGLGFRVWGSGFWVEGLGFRAGRSCRRRGGYGDREWIYVYRGMKGDIRKYNCYIHRDIYIYIYTHIYGC